MPFYFINLLPTLLLYISILLACACAQHDLVNIARPSNLLGSVLHPRGPTSTSNVCKTYGGRTVKQRLGRLLWKGVWGAALGNRVHPRSGTSQGRAHSPTPDRRVSKWRNMPWDDDVFYLMMMSLICSCRNKIGAELHVYLEEGTYHKRMFRGPSTNNMKN